MTGHNNIDGTWKEISSAHCNIGGSWKEIKEGYAKISGDSWVKQSSKPSYSTLFSYSSSKVTTLVDMVFYVLRGDYSGTLFLPKGISFSASSSNSASFIVSTYTSSSTTNVVRLNISNSDYTAGYVYSGGGSGSGSISYGDSFFVMIKS